MRGKLLRHHGVNGQHDFAPGRLCLDEDIARRRDEFAFAERSAHGLALCG